jgi:hypothetical protein
VLVEKIEEDKVPSTFVGGIIAATIQEHLGSNQGTCREHRSAGETTACLKGSLLSSLVMACSLIVVIMMMIISLFGHEGCGRPLQEVEMYPHKSLML